MRRCTEAPTAAGAISPTLPPEPRPCVNRFWLLGYTSDTVGAALSSNDEDVIFVEWYMEGAWTPKEVWFSGENATVARRAIIGWRKYFEHPYIPQKVCDCPVLCTAACVLSLQRGRCGLMATTNSVWLGLQT